MADDTGGEAATMPEIIVEEFQPSEAFRANENFSVFVTLTRPSSRTELRVVGGFSTRFQPTEKKTRTDLPLRGHLRLDGFAHQSPGVPAPRQRLPAKIP